MYTADNARAGDQVDLDERIRHAVKENRCGNTTTLRIYSEDWFRYTIEEELHKRGFKNVHVPDITLKGDVYFEWDSN